MKSNSSQLSYCINPFPGVERFIYQPNRITNAHYNYTLIQERIMNCVIFHLQEAIKKRMKGEDYKQLKLFEDNASDDIVLEIPLREIASKQQYSKVKDSCKLLAGLVVVIPYLDKSNNQHRLRYTGLLRADIPEKEERSSTIRVEIDRKVAKLLVEIELNGNNTAINYTKFQYDLTMRARRKHTPRIYKLLCSWRIKGSFIISLDDFKERMGIKYQYYRDIKKYILEPAQKELEEMNADCWFDCNDSRFAIKKRSTVTHLHFQVISPKLFRKHELLRESIRLHLKSDFHFSDDLMSEINEIISNEDPGDIWNKLEYLEDFIRNTKKPIMDIKSYIIKSLQKNFTS